VSGDADTSVPEPFFDDSVDPFAPPPAVESPQPVIPPPPGVGPYPPPGPGPHHPYGPWQPGPWAPYPPVRSTNGFAIAALICGLVGLVSYGLGGVLGIVFGIVGLRQIRQDGQAGRGLAIAGIVVGAVTLALGMAVVALLLAHTSGATNGNFLVS
jgi:hypothetical protein